MQYELIEELTRNFYEWEQRGRGWDVYNFPVDPEPPFVPFYYHYASHVTQIDDGRKPTLLSSFVDKLKNVLAPTSTQNALPEHPLFTIQDAVPNQFRRSDEIQEIKIVLPSDYKMEAEYLEQCILGITLHTSLISFEILGTHESITVQFTCCAHDTTHLSQQLLAYFPECTLSISGNTFYDRFFPDSEDDTVVVDFGLSEEFMRPIRVYDSFDPDPLTGIIGVLENLAEEEVGLFQILFTPVESPWSLSIMRSVMNHEGDSFFADAPEMVKLAQAKCKSPLFAVNVRLIAKGANPNRSWEIVKAITSCLSVYTLPQSNELIPLTNHEYNNTVHCEDVILRQTRRSGMILNCEELLSLAHFPSASIVSQKLRGQNQKSNRAPESLYSHEYILGENIHNGISHEVSLSHEQRLRHMHIIGATGTGKSTLLHSLIMQDIEHGLGIAVLDPHGDLIDSILENIPQERHKDVVIFDPSDDQYPIGFNILEAKTEVEKNVLSSDLVEIFKRFSTSWGDQMSVVLGNAISAFLESDRSGSLMDLRKFLIEKDFRETFLESVSDDHVAYFWEKEFPLLRGTALSSILTRLDFFLRPKLIRNIVAQPKGIDLKEIVNSKKILLVKLSQGIIGDENAYLLGSLLVSKLNQVVMQRQLQSSHEREPFYLYIDEFQNFITPSMKAMLSGARKYHMGLILAHQDLHQLWETDTGLANSIISNAGTRICFRIGDFDAQKLESGFTHFDTNDLQNLSIGDAVVRVERSDYDFNIKTLLPLNIVSEQAQKNKNEIIELSRKKYGGIPVVIERIKSDPQIYPLSHTPIKRKAEKKESATTNKIDVITLPVQNENQKNITYHKYLQTLIKQLAEQRGYKAVVEEQTLDKLGRVDVGLERDGEKIACEISVTTNDDHELKNIEKCFQSGYSKVLFCSPEQKRIDAVRKLITDKLAPQYLDKVFFMLPDKLILFFEEETIKEIKKGNENVIKGYRVKVEYKTISETQKKEKQDLVSGVVVRALRRLKRDL
ncbi:MAG: type IV secretion system DNA-binding domain-containing protein [Ignavibacteriales bacterium]|nr:type IV secretion system DNA-binding domain-containing protein [Ignavibacteriales bacterium]